MRLAPLRPANSEAGSAALDLVFPAPDPEGSGAVGPGGSVAGLPGGRDAEAAGLGAGLGFPGAAAAFNADGSDGEVGGEGGGLTTPDNGGAEIGAAGRGSSTVVGKAPDAGTAATPRGAVGARSEVRVAVGSTGASRRVRTPGSC